MRTYTMEGEAIKTYGSIERDENSSSLNLPCRKLLSPEFKREFKPVLQITWPTVSTTLLMSSIGPISLMFCGHLSRVDLGGAAMAISLLNIFGMSLGYGIASACDTFFPQAFGSPHKHMMGTYLQRGFIMMLMTWFICWSYLLNVEVILVSLGQSAEVSRIAGEYILYYLPGLLFAFIGILSTKYMQNQNAVLAPVVIGLLGNVCNAVLQYFNVYVLNLGTKGSAMAQTLSFFIIALIFFSYVKLSGMYKETWNGWSWQALNHWGQYTQLALGGLGMLAMEWWSLEAGIFLTGLLGEVPLAVNSCIFQFQVIQCVVGVSIAASILVGQRLGAGDAVGAKAVLGVARTLAWIVFFVNATIVVAFGRHILRLFTTDSEVIQLASQMLPLLAYVYFLDSTVYLAGGIFRGCGRQWLGAVCNFVAYVTVGLPMAAVFMFVLKLGAVGFWLGIVVGTTPAAVAYSVILYKTDWENQVKRARERLGYSSKEANDTVRCSGNVDVDSLGEVMSDTQWKEPCKHTGESQRKRPCTHTNEPQGKEPFTRTNESQGKDSSAQRGKPQGKEPSTHTNEPQMTRQEILKLIARRSILLLMVLAIFMTGVSLRVWIIPPKSLNNATYL